MLSLGVGVESTTMYLMAEAGELGPKPDVAIFADTVDETDAVYEQLRWLQSPNMGCTIPIVTVSAGNIAEDWDAVTTGTKKRMPNPPLFIKNDDGSKGQMVRGCTRDYKIVPVEREVRRLLGLGPRGRLPNAPLVEMWIGLATNEIIRVVPSVKPHIHNRHPLIEAGFSTWDCLLWTWRKYGVWLKSSGCRRCPFRSDTEWARLQREEPDTFAVAVAADEAARSGFPNLRGEAFIHDSLQPLGAIDFASAASAKNGWLDDCSGRCGV